MSIKKPGVKYLLFVISAAAHIFVYLDYIYLKDSFTVPVHWHIQFYILLIFSISLSLLLPFIKKYILFLLSLKFLSLLLIGYPLGEYLGIEIILLISIIMETVFYLPQYYGAPISILFILITFLNQKPVNIWGSELEKADKHSLLFMLFITFLILFISYSIKKISLSSEQKSQDLLRLDYAVKELTKINLDFQSYAASIEYNSIENERKRVSREMHDIIGYTLTNQLMIIQAALSMKQNLSHQMESLLLQAQKQTREGMDDARHALRKLRDFSPGSEIGSKLIYKLTKTFEQITGVSVSIDFGNTPMTLGEQIDSAIYRLIQEGLTNAFRHGKATMITITLFIGKDKLYVSIWDNGRGSDKINEGIGLKGMRERIEKLHGRIETKSISSGFTIKVQIPYSGSTEENE